MNMKKLQNTLSSTVHAARENPSHAVLGGTSVLERGGHVEAIQWRKRSWDIWRDGLGNHALCHRCSWVWSAQLISAVLNWVPEKKRERRGSEIVKEGDHLPWEPRRLTGSQHTGHTWEPKGWVLTVWGTEGNKIDWCIWAAVGRIRIFISFHSYWTDFICTDYCKDAWGHTRCTGYDVGQEVSRGREILMSFLKVTSSASRYQALPSGGWEGLLLLCSNTSFWFVALNTCQCTPWKT